MSDMELIMFMIIICAILMVFSLAYLFGEMANYINARENAKNNIEINNISVNEIYNMVGLIISQRKIMEHKQEDIQGQRKFTMGDFLELTEVQKLAVYALALKEEKYELLVELDKLVDDNFRKEIPDMMELLENFFGK